MPKSSQTGTQKKLTKQLAHEGRKGAEYRKKGLKEAAQYAPSAERFRHLEEHLLSGLNAYEPYGLYKPYSTEQAKPYQHLEKFLKGGEAYGQDLKETKNLEQFLPGGKLYQKPDYFKESQQGLELAQRALAPIQQQAISQFQTQVAPSVANQFGGSEVKTSSALRQALASAATNLQSQLGAQLGGLAAQYGSDISRMNLAEGGRQQELQYGASQDLARFGLGERARQQQLQYGAAFDIFGQQRGADIARVQEEAQQRSYLAQLGLGVAGHLQGAGLPGAQLGIGVNPYRGAGAGGISPGSAALSGGLSGAGTGALAGAAIGGPFGAGIGAGIGGVLGAGGGYLAAR